MQQVFRVVLVGITKSRTVDSIGGTANAPDALYVGLRRTGGVVDINQPLLLVENVDNEMDMDTYNTYMPCKFKHGYSPSNQQFFTIDPLFDQNLEVISAVTGNFIMPRLITSNDEIIVTYEFRNEEPLMVMAASLLEGMVKPLEQAGFNAHILSKETCKELVAQSKAIHEATAVHDADPANSASNAIPLMAEPTMSPEPPLVAPEPMPES